MTPYYSDDWVTLYLGDCREVPSCVVFVRRLVTGVLPRTSYRGRIEVRSDGHVPTGTGDAYLLRAGGPGVTPARHRLSRDGGVPEQLPEHRLVVVTVVPLQTASDGKGLRCGLLKAPGRVRTANLRLSRPVLCPIKLRGRSVIGREGRSCSRKRPSPRPCRDHRPGAGFTSCDRLSERVSSQGRCATSTAQRRQRPARGALALGGHMTPRRPAPTRIVEALTRFVGATKASSAVTSLKNQCACTEPYRCYTPERDVTVKGAQR